MKWPPLCHLDFLGGTPYKWLILIWCIHESFFHHPHPTLIVSQLAGPYYRFACYCSRPSGNGTNPLHWEVFGKGKSGVVPIEEWWAWQVWASGTLQSELGKRQLYKSSCITWKSSWWRVTNASFLSSLVKSIEHIAAYKLKCVPGG